MSIITKVLSGYIYNRYGYGYVTVPLKEDFQKKRKCIFKDDKIFAIIDNIEYNITDYIRNDRNIASFLSYPVDYFELIDAYVIKGEDRYIKLVINFRLRNIKNMANYLNSNTVLRYELFGNKEHTSNINFLDYDKIITPIYKSKLDYKFKIDLFDYQKNNIELIKNIIKKPFMINYNEKINIGTDKRAKYIYYDYKKNKFGNQNKELKITIDGAILADEMGLGKTISALAYLRSLPPREADINTLRAKGHLIIVPSHLVKQWGNELNKLYDNAKVYYFLTKKDHIKITVDELLTYDYVIVSQSFLSNIRYYLQYPNYSTTESRFNIKRKLEKLNSIIKVNDKIDNKKVRELYPIFELINWNYIVLDEAHEIMNYNYNNCNTNLLSVINNIKSDKKLYMSGTPYGSERAYKTILEYLNCKIEDEHISTSIYKNSIFNEEYVKHVVIRHNKDQIKDQINLKGLEEKIYWLEQTDIEKQIYNGSKNRGRDYLLKLCCHLMIADTNSTMKLQTIDINVVKENIINTAKYKIEIYTNKLNGLNPLSQAYHALKKQYTDIISHNKFMMNAINNFGKTHEDNEDIEDDCGICLDLLDDPTILPCGHVFCFECINMVCSTKKLCPMCKQPINDKLVKVDKKIEKKVTDSLVDKYGAKTGNLIKLVRKLTIENESENNNIIIFSQYDFMLKLISDSLKECGVSNSFVKGNVFQRNKAIDSFKGIRSGEKSNVIMLSLHNKASGTQLDNANHIIFVDIMNKYKEDIQIIEQQAIGRAYRIGQKRKVTIHRLIIKNTVENEIFNNKYEKLQL